MLGFLFYSWYSAGEWRNYRWDKWWVHTWHGCDMAISLCTCLSECEWFWDCETTTSNLSIMRTSCDASSGKAYTCGNGSTAPKNLCSDVSYASYASDHSASFAFVNGSKVLCSDVSWTKCELCLCDASYASGRSASFPFVVQSSTVRFGRHSCARSTLQHSWRMSLAQEAAPMLDSIDVTHLQWECLADALYSMRCCSCCRYMLSLPRICFLFMSEIENSLIAQHSLSHDR